MFTGSKWDYSQFFGRFRKALTMVLLTGIIAGPAKSQSQFGCRSLVALPEPMTEGANGVFFRTDPDLVMYNRFSQPVIEQIATLRRELAKNGTALIVVPIPTKAQAMPHALSQNTLLLGYENALSSTIFSDNVDRMRSAGVATVDVTPALLDIRSGQLPYFPTDPRMTNAGLRAIASSVADAIFLDAAYGPSPKASFTTALEGEATLTSLHHSDLQALCQDQLPQPSDKMFRTSRSDTEVEIPKVALVTTEITGTPELNYAGFISELTGFDTEHFSVSGSAIDAIASYLTSETFFQERPEFIVWNVPVWHNLATFGDQPMREAIAAAGKNCALKLNAELQPDGALTIDLGGIEFGPEDTLNLITSQKHRKVVFEFANDEGYVRKRTILRKEMQPDSNRFFMPMTGLWPAQTKSLAIRTDAPMGEKVTVNLCGQPE